jgi:hypothetical protein
MGRQFFTASYWRGWAIDALKSKEKGVSLTD